jgi:predicted ArsR family transcriptional regulator
METERITLSQRERDRLKVLHEVQQKQLTQVGAAERLKVSDRHVRRMLLGLRERGDRSLVHGLRGRPSNRKLATRFEQKILARLRQRYADFGPTLAAEHLAQEGFSVSRETLRKWMTQAALWPTASRTCGKNRETQKQNQTQIPCTGDDEIYFWRGRNVPGPWSCRDMVSNG